MKNGRQLPRSLIYFSTDVESVLMSETEKSCWALAKEGGSLQLPRYLGNQDVECQYVGTAASITRLLNAAWHGYKLQPQLQSRLCELLPGPTNCFRFVKWIVLVLLCVHCAVCFVYNAVWDCQRCYTLYLYIHYLRHMVLCTCPSQYEYCTVLFLQWQT